MMIFEKIKQNLSQKKQYTQMIGWFIKDQYYDGQVRSITFFEKYRSFIGNFLGIITLILFAFGQIKYALISLIVLHIHIMCNQIYVKQKNIEHLIKEK